MTPPITLREEPPTLDETIVAVAVQLVEEYVATHPAVPPERVGCEAHEVADEIIRQNIHWSPTEARDRDECIAKVVKAVNEICAEDSPRLVRSSEGESFHLSQDIIKGREETREWIEAQTSRRR